MFLRIVIETTENNIVFVWCSYGNECKNTCVLRIAMETIAKAMFFNAFLWPTLKNRREPKRTQEIQTRIQENPIEPKKTQDVSDDGCRA